MKEIRVTNKSDKNDIMNIAFEFVESAKATAEEREQLRAVFLFEYKGLNCLAASDGARLHLANADFLEGLNLEGKEYQVFKMENGKKNYFLIEETNCPVVISFKRLLNETPKGSAFSMKIEASSRAKKESDKFFEFIHKVEHFSSQTDGFKINYNFLKPLAGNDWQIFKQRGIAEPIYFASPLFFAIIMTIREGERPKAEENSLETFFINKEPLEAAAI